MGIRREDVLIIKIVAAIIIILVFQLNSWQTERDRNKPWSCGLQDYITSI